MKSKMQYLHAGHRDPKRKRGIDAISKRRNLKEMLAGDKSADGAMPGDKRESK